MHGIGRDQAAFVAKVFDQCLRRRDIVAFVVSGEMAEDHHLILGKGAQHMGGLLIIAPNCRPAPFASQDRTSCLAAVTHKSHARRRENTPISLQIVSIEQAQMLPAQSPDADD